MRKALLPILLLLALPIFADDEPVRNPFWPQGFEGPRYPISINPRYPTQPERPAEEPAKPKLKPGETLKTVTNSLGRVMQVIEPAKQDKPETKDAKVPPAKTAEEIENELWTAASGQLHSSNPLSYEVDGTRRQSVTINGLVYADGDLISVNASTNRFTWLIRGVSTNGALRVERLKRRVLTNEELKSSKSDNVKKAK